MGMETKLIIGGVAVVAVGGVALALYLKGKSAGSGDGSDGDAGAAAERARLASLNYAPTNTALASVPFALEVTDDPRGFWMPANTPLALAHVPFTVDASIVGIATEVPAMTPGSYAVRCVPPAYIEQARGGFNDAQNQGYFFPGTQLTINCPVQALSGGRELKGWKLGTGEWVLNADGTRMNAQRWWFNVPMDDTDIEAVIGWTWETY